MTNTTGTCLVSTMTILLVSSQCMSQNAPPNNNLCEDVSKYLSPCVPYFMKSEPTPTGACCGGLKRLNKYANVTDLRPSLCNCFLEFLTSSSSGDPSLFSGLPDVCAVNIPLPKLTSLTFDCSKYATRGC